MPDVLKKWEKIISFESILVDLTFHSQKVIIGLYYRPPNCNEFYDLFDQQFNSISHRKNIILIGDFNSDLSANTTSNSVEMKKLLIQQQLHNVIKEPTRIISTTKTLLDLCITSKKEIILKCGVYDPGIADHRLIFAITKLRKKI